MFRVDIAHLLILCADLGRMESRAVHYSRCPSGRTISCVRCSARPRGGSIGGFFRERNSRPQIRRLNAGDSPDFAERYILCQCIEWVVVCKTYHCEEIPR